MIGWVFYTLMTLLMFTSLLMIGLILLQRGKGGGITGALGGMGGQSAFGTKAGDLFTRITVVMAVVWILLAGISTTVGRNLVHVGIKEGANAERESELTVPPKPAGPDGKVDPEKDQADQRALEKMLEESTPPVKPEGGEAPNKPNATEDKTPAGEPEKSSTPANPPANEPAPEKPATTETPPTDSSSTPPKTE